MNVSDSMIWLLGGFSLGVAVGTTCVAVCGGLLLPMVISTQRTLRHSLGLFLQFSAGRLIAYTAFGVVAGVIGIAIHEHAWYQWVGPLAYVAAGLMLLRFVATQARKCGCSSAAPARWQQIPLVVGFLTGANVCPPFISAIAVAVTAGSVVRAVGYFLAFFVGTSVWLAPIACAGMLTRWQPWVRLGRLAGVLAGFAYVFAGLHGAHELLYPPAHEQYAGSAETNGYRIDSRTLPTRFAGYGGEVPVLLEADASGVVTRVTVLQHNETSGFLDYVTNTAWWIQWRGKRLADVLALTAVPDDISGATVTAEALRLTLHACANQALYPDASAAPRMLSTASAGMEHWDTLAVCLLVLGLVALMMLMARLGSAWLRWGIWLLTVGLLGFHRANYFSIGQLANCIHGHWMPLSRVSWQLMFWFALVSPLFWGRAYCRLVCPFCVLSEILYEVVPGRLTLPAAAVRGLRWVKYVLLGATCVLIVALPDVPVDRLEPFQAIFMRMQPAQYIMFGVAVLAASCFIKRFWCMLFCIDGALFELLTQFRITDQEAPRARDAGEQI